MEPLGQWSPVVQLLGTRQGVVDGCQGVVRYGPEEVLLRVDRRVLRLWGRDLRLVRLTPTGALVEGTLRGAEYLD
ncbi:MAG TPA: hypothetical protein H9838_01735 [Candidatus Acutalibacter pullistercoris]|uniref:Sporulation protein YqfC n=1 Tax=Candidatus Acutalibacter pullistercoris TaxID=2838418 RepID=A0A9D1YBG1_9FIRM|nr:hypothetical protein [Candidatus Acutalibacter pullistercoris]